jgi:hypothetical protein
MATSNGLRGKQGFILSLKIGAGTATLLGDDVKSYELTSDDADDSDVTFAEALAGLNKVWTFSVTAIVSYDTGSLYQYLWTNPGATFAVDIAPWGNATATATKPHFTFTANANGKPGLSNTASTDTTRADFDYDFSVVGDVTPVIA